MQFRWKRVLFWAAIVTLPMLLIHLLTMLIIGCDHCTVISHGIEQGLTPQQAASIAGHSSTRMVNEVYGHMITKPKLPTGKTVCRQFVDNL